MISMISPPHVVAPRFGRLCSKTKNELKHYSNVSVMNPKDWSLGQLMQFKTIEDAVLRHAEKPSETSLEALKAFAQCLEPAMAKTILLRLSDAKGTRYLKKSVENALLQQVKKAPFVTPKGVAFNPQGKAKLQVFTVEYKESTVNGSARRRVILSQPASLPPSSFSSLPNAQKLTLSLPSKVKG